MQRLFSTFPCGFPGAGLLLLRVTLAVPLARVVFLTRSPGLVEVVAGAAATLLLIGLWTPVASGVFAVAQFGLAWSHPEDPWPFIQLGAVGAALAMLGPGGCSVDARLFGRKQIHIPTR